MSSERTPLLSTSAAPPTSQGAVDDRSPLLEPSPAPLPPSAPSSSRTSPYKRLFSPYNRLLLTTALLSAAFTLTATQILYSCKVMICEEYWRDDGHGWAGEGDRCRLPEIEARTAVEISRMVTLTTLAGILNLLTTGYVTKRAGVRRAMLFQTAWPCVRNLVQTWGVLHGGMAGVRAFQLSQLITIGGGGAGYMLTANTYCSELVEPDARTAAFGRLQGVQFLGTAAGLMVGGVLGAKLHPAAPFLAALICLVLSTFLSGCFLPYIPPPEQTEASKAKGRGGMLAPIKVFRPRRVTREDGSSGGRWYGLALLSLGAFVAVFATSFIPMLLQLIGTNRYGFKPDTNGYLMSLASLSRAVFLYFAFPSIIAAGRRWYSTSPARFTPSPSSPSSSSASTLHIPTTPAEIEPLEPVFQTDQVIEPALPPEPTSEQKGSHFDLLFLRLSILLDGVLTALVPLSSQGWHLFAAAGILPLASGTAPAAKGVVLEMLADKDEHADALQGIAMSETLAMMLTIAASGWVFAKLSEVGRAEETFYLNAANALLSFLILLFARFPPRQLSRITSLV
ncbi:hypothetical protein JCM10213_006751 [Rhodosporidiobolus nylandii]